MKNAPNIIKRISIQGFTIIDFIMRKSNTVYGFNGVKNYILWLNVYLMTGINVIMKQAALFLLMYTNHQEVNVNFYEITKFLLIPYISKTSTPYTFGKNGKNQPPSPRKKQTKRNQTHTYRQHWIICKCI